MMHAMQISHILILLLLIIKLKYVNSLLFCAEIPLSGHDLHRAVVNWEVEKVKTILEERLVENLWLS